MSKRWLSVGLLLLISIATWLVLRGTGGSPARRVVIVTLDTLRADHLGAYGYPRATSPSFDRMAREGVLFEKAFAPMASTSPVHASLFTGLYPRQHGVLRNGHRLPDSFVTLAERMGQAGFTTAAFVGTDVHFGPGNIAQGFRHLDEPGVPFDGAYRGAAATIDAAIEWLERLEPDERFLLWVHLFDPHDPYSPPLADLEAVIDDSWDRRDSFAALYVAEQKIALNHPVYGGEVSRLLTAMDIYDAEIHYADRELGRLDDTMRLAGLDHDTLWVVTADHGEGLGAHRWFGHGKEIYNEQIRAPLVIRLAAGDTGTTVPDVVELTDVMPTILDLADVEPGTTDDRPGRSLRPLLGFGGSIPPRVAFAQRREFGAPLPAPDPDRMNWETAEKYAVQDGRHKYIHRTDGIHELYALEDDPYEVRNLAGQGAAEEERLREILLDKLERYGEAQPAETIDEDALLRLRSLGYVQ